jgi:hypothetical protein
MNYVFNIHIMIILLSWWLLFRRFVTIFSMDIFHILNILNILFILNIGSAGGYTDLFDL